MNVFASVKEAVTTREAAEFYNLKVSHNGMCSCPFHQDRHPSMKVDTRFHCFSCGEDGDVIDFVSKFFSLSKKDAAVKLASDFGISYDSFKYEVKENTSPYVRPKSERELFKEAENRFVTVLSTYCHILRQWKQEYAPKDPDEVWDKRYVEALEKLDRIESVYDQYLAASKEEQKLLVKETQELVSQCERRLAENGERSVLKRLQDKEKVTEMLPRKREKQKDKEPAIA